MPKRLAQHRPPTTLARQPTLRRRGGNLYLVEPGKPSDADQALAKRLRSTDRWQRLRLMKLARAPLCEYGACGRITPATVVHHILAVSRRPDLAFTLTNLLSLCRTCHDLIEQRIGAGDDPLAAIIKPAK